MSGKCVVVCGKSQVKYCRKCGTVLHEENWRPSDRRCRQKRCKDCAAIEDREKYAKRRTKARAEQAEYHRRTGHKRRDAMRECSARHYKNNRLSYQANVRKRRARVRGADGSHTAQDIRDIYAEQGGKCAACGADLSTGYHVDHIQAIINGGSNDRGNLQILCPHCNLSKGSKDYEEFLLYLELRTQSLVESA